MTQINSFNDLLQEVPKTPELFLSNNRFNQQIVPSIDVSSDTNSSEDNHLVPNGGQQQRQVTQDFTDDQTVPQIRDQTEGSSDESKDSMKTKISPFVDNIFENSFDSSLTTESEESEVLTENRFDLRIKRKLNSKRFHKSSKVFKRRVSVFNELPENSSDRRQLKCFDAEE